RRHRISDYLLTAAEGSWLWRPSARDGFQTLLDLSRQLTHEPSTCHEKRYPFLDQSLTQFLTSIPPNQLLRPRDRRSLMRRALKGVLPDELLNRKTKAVGARSIALTLEKQQRSIEMLLECSLTARFDISSESALRNALDSTRHGQISDHVVSLLKTLALELWL